MCIKVRCIKSNTGAHYYRDGAQERRSLAGDSLCCPRFEKNKTNAEHCLCYPIESI